MKDIYDYPKRLEQSIRRLEKRDIPKENKEAILKFKQYLVFRNYSLPRIIKYIEILSTVSTIVGKPFSKYGEKEISIMLERLQTKGVAEWTKITYNTIVKTFSYFLIMWFQAVKNTGVVPMP
jgi:hypothetical protein